MCVHTICLPRLDSPRLARDKLQQFRFCAVAAARARTAASCTQPRREPRLHPQQQHVAAGFILSTRRLLIIRSHTIQTNYRTTGWLAGRITTLSVFTFLRIYLFIMMLRQSCACLAEDKAKYIHFLQLCQNRVDNVDRSYTEYSYVWPRPGQAGRQAVFPHVDKQLTYLASNSK